MNNNFTYYMQKRKEKEKRYKEEYYYLVIEYEIFHILHVILKKKENFRGANRKVTICQQSS